MILPSPRRPSLRFAAGVLAVLHLLVPGVAGAVDLLEESHAAAVEVHLEETGSDDCRGGHDHLFCQVVRSLTQGAATSPGGTFIAAAPPAPSVRPLPGSDLLPRPVPTGRLNSRAPPAA